MHLFWHHSFSVQGCPSRQNLTQTLLLTLDVLPAAWWMFFAEKTPTITFKLEECLKTFFKPMHLKTFPITPDHFKGYPALHVAYSYSITAAVTEGACSANVPANV